MPNLKKPVRHPIFQFYNLYKFPCCLCQSQKDDHKEMKLPRSFLPKLSSTRDVALNSEAIHPGSSVPFTFFHVKLGVRPWTIFDFHPESLGKLFFMIQFDQYIFFKHGLKLTHQPPKQKKSWVVCLNNLPRFKAFTAMVVQSLHWTMLLISFWGHPKMDHPGIG